jgi:hypothetical protein
MSLSDAELRGRYIAYRQAQTEAVLATELPPAGSA